MQKLLISKAIVLSLILCSSTFATAEDKKDGWVSLFNGKDLKGWTQKNGTAPYKVVEGTIQGTTAERSPNSFLCSDKDYSDFELVFEVKVDNRLNSGVQIRSRSLKEYKNGRVHGPQVEIEAAPGEAGYIYSEGTGRGWLSQDRSKQKTFKNDKWNEYRVKAVGSRIQTWVNGEPVADLKDEKSSKKGFIGLQVHSFKGDSPATVQWRNIKIREIKTKN